MSFRKKGNKPRDKLLSEIEKLRAQLADAKETICTIRSGKIDALVVSTPQGDQVFTLKGAERPYRILMERMKEGAVTLAGDNTIFYCNQGFADMLKTPLEKMIGAGISQFISPADKPMFEELLRQGRESSSKGEVTFLAGDGTAVPTYLSINTMLLEELSTVYLVATDITQHKQAEEALQKAHDELEIKIEERTRELVEANEELHVEITERKRAEDEIKELVASIQEEKDRLSALVKSIPDEVWFADANHNIVLVNPAVLKAFGSDTFDNPEVESIAGNAEIYRPDGTARPVEEAPPLRALRGEEVRDQEEIVRIPATGELKIRQVNASPVMDAAGNIIGSVAVVRDITERKQIEDSLRQSQQTFVDLVEGAPFGIYIVDSQFCISHMNAGSQTGAFQNVRPVIGRDFAEAMCILWHEPVATEIIANFRHTLETGEPYYSPHFTNLRHDIKAMESYEWELHRMTLPSGEYGVVCYYFDSTKLREAEEALRRSEERLRFAQEVAHVGTFDWNIVTGVNIWTPELEAMYGLPPGGFAKTQSTWESLVHPEDRAQALRKVETTFKTGQPVEGEWRVVWPDGSVHWLARRWQIFKDKSGQPLRMTGVNIDITGRKQAEEALHKAHDELELRVQERTVELEETNKALLESEASYRELTESINEVFFRMDRELRYTYWNKASEALTGILAKDAIGKSLYELFPDIKGTKAEQLYIEALKTQQPQRFESQLQLGDNKFTFEISAYPTKTGLSVIAKDITEKKMFEAHLLRAQRMESIGILAGGIAHNLNNMLTPIMMSLQMLKEKFKDEQSQKLLTILEQNSHRGADLIKQVLSFSRGMEGERIPLQIKYIIAEIEKIAKETFPRNIEIRTDIQKDLSIISGDATQLHQVIMNLCVNARDAMPDGGILNISAENLFVDEGCARMHTEAKVGSYVAIAVSDTGVGIPPKILDRIFDPFFTTKEFGKGTGLGLSTSLAIVKSHGGFINVDSEVGKGTTFWVYLPVIKTEIQTVEEQQVKPLNGHGELILLVEDESSIRETTCLTLETYGYKVLTANDGADATILYAQNKDNIKVVLMDMMMPVMDGHASSRAIRKINPEAKIIAVSGLAEKDKLKNVADYTDAFLPKPYTAERLLKTISEIMNAK